MGQPGSLASGHGLGGTNPGATLEDDSAASGVRERMRIKCGKRTEAGASDAFGGVFVILSHIDQQDGVVGQKAGYFGGTQILHRCDFPLGVQKRCGAQND